MRTLLIAGLAIVGTLFYTSVGAARMAPPQPIAARVAKSDIVLIGKVIDIEKDPVKTKEGTEYHIASVKIADGLLGTKGLTHVKVGFLPGGGRGRPTALQAGQEVCLFLQKAPGENFYVSPMYYDTIQKQDNPDFAKESEEAKKVAEYITKADEHLKSKDAKVRYLAAATNLLHHRAQRPGNDKTTELDADRSKQLLETLRDADWKDTTGAYGLQPLQVFLALRLGKDDGWAPTGDLTAAAKKWLEDNAGKYRIKSYAAQESK